MEEDREVRYNNFFIDIQSIGSEKGVNLTYANKRLYQLPLNFLMSMQNPVYPVQYIVGTVVFARCKPCNPYEEEIWDFEVADVTEEDIKQIEGYLSDYYQSALRLAVQKAMYDK